MAYGLSYRAAATLVLALAGATLAAGPCLAQAKRVRITKLQDVAFGQLNSLADTSIAQSLCVFSSAPSGGYTVQASGSGGAFVLTSGANVLPYSVQWAETAGQTGGTALEAGIASQPFQSIASQQACQSGAPVSATLIVRLSGTDTANARAGSYTGTLTILIAPG